MNEEVIAERLAVSMMGEKVARSLVAKKLNYGIVDRNLSSSVDDVMVSLAGDIEVLMGYDWSVSGRYIPQTYDSPAEYPELEIYDVEADVLNPKPIPLGRFLKLVIKGLQKTQRSVNITPEQMMADRQMMKVVLTTMEGFRELEDMPMDIESDNSRGGSGGEDVVLTQQGRFVRSGRVVFDYEVSESELDRVVERMYENPESYAPSDFGP